jgi:hypothetical protein
MRQRAVKVVTDEILSSRVIGMGRGNEEYQTTQHYLFIKSLQTERRIRLSL